MGNQQSMSIFYQKGHKMLSALSTPCANPACKGTVVPTFPSFCTLGAVGRRRKGTKGITQHTEAPSKEARIQGRRRDPNLLPGPAVNFPFAWGVCLLQEPICLSEPAEAAAESRSCGNA